MSCSSRLCSDICRVCCSALLEEVEAFRSLPRVTSDCIPFRSGGRLLVCRQCRAAQAPADDQWFEEIHEIYTKYYAYRQAEGVEQAVRDGSSGELSRRSDLLLSYLADIAGMPTSGRILDVGCGTGATLQAFAKRGGWRLYGLEIDEKNLAFLERIKGFDSLYTCHPAELPVKFNVITMVHALEHFPEPLTALRDLRIKIADGGFLFVQVPNAAANPFDYVIADHMMHFTAGSLIKLVSNAGFRADSCSSSWIPKELSLVARSNGSSSYPLGEAFLSPAIHDVHRQIQWLNRFVNVASEAMATSANFGLFGTAIAATWLCSILGEKVSFFVEEDVSRVGRQHMGRPVVAPDDIEPGSTVFVALTPNIADQIFSRLRISTVKMVLPPRFDVQSAHQLPRASYE